MKRRTKYNAQTCRCNQAHIHASRAEAAYCNNLYLDIRAVGSKIAEVYNQPTVVLIAGIKWRLDFRVQDKDESSHLVDVKGMETREFRLKLKLYRWMLKEGTMTEALLIARPHWGRSAITFSETWYQVDKSAQP